MLEKSLSAWENTKGSETLEIKVSGLGILKNLIADPIFSVKKGATLSILLKQMMKKYGPPLQQAILDPESQQVHSIICILRNGRIVENLNEELKAGDEITLFIPVSGG
jgi:molybdopterin converting factor small subunit